MVKLIFILGLPTVLMAVAALAKGIWRNFLAALLISFLGIVLPLLVFLASAGLTPMSKADAPHAWIDCFMRGKLALIPLTLWASAAFLAQEIYRVDDRKKNWIVLGYCVGAVVSIVCTVFGLIYARKSRLSIFLLVPSYVTFWYCIRAVSLMRAAGLKVGAYAKTFLSSLPFWIAGVLWSRKIYESLPDKPPDCFVVTAAMQGRPRFVGPFFEIARQNHRQMANHQLATLWRFENVWRTQAPLSHGAFRRIYNRVGPLIARRIACPWIADIVYLAIKPAEFLALLTLAISETNALRTDAQTGAHGVTCPTIAETFGNKEVL